MPELLPAIRTVATPAEVGQALRRAWEEQLGDEPPRSALLTLLAQWALETGRGASCVAWNFAGIKSAPNDGRSWAFVATKERLPKALAEQWLRVSTQAAPVSLVKIEGGHYVVQVYPDHPACRFRAYATIDAGAADYLRLLREKYSSAWDALSDPDAFARRLKALGYYTANPNVYAASLVSLSREYASLDLELHVDRGAALAAVDTSTRSLLDDLRREGERSHDDG